MGNERTAAESETPRKRLPVSRKTARRVDATGLARLQQRVGNRAVLRLIAQCRGAEPAELDDETAEHINRARSSGLPLDAEVARQMGAALGQDLSGVRVHTSLEADRLNRRLGAQAFTTGSDVFFSAGAYQPHTSSGQELIGHELTHVVQQGSGAAAGSGRMTVNPPGDEHEREADRVARTLVTGIQRDTLPSEEDEEIRPQLEDEEEEQVP